MLKNLTAIISLTIIVCALAYLFPRQTSFDAAQTAGPVLVEVEKIIEKEPPALLAKSACVFDMSKNEFIFELNNNVQRPLASLTKLMTVLVAKENFPEGLLVEITKEAIEKEGDNGLIVGEKWKLADIIDIILLSSSNDAAFALSCGFSETPEPNNTQFLKLMNNKAAALGMKQTYFFNATGLDISDSAAGAYGSCEDTVKLMNYMLRNYADVLEITTRASLNLNDRVFENTNKIINKFPLLLAGKTGFDDLAGGNLIIAVNKGLNRPIIIAVLGSTFDGRFEDIEKLYDHFVK